ncbi:SVM family protein [Candidatus Phytoplasma fraxini]
MLKLKNQFQITYFYLMTFITLILIFNNAQLMAIDNKKN